MSSLPACERRAAQRFEFTFPVSIRVADDPRERSGFTQNVTGRGMYLFADCELAEGSHLELTFRMPAEITLTDAMRVRCTAKVLRVVRSMEGAKFGIAVCFESYTYLSETGLSPEHNSGERISWLHRRKDAAEDLGGVSPR